MKRDWILLGAAMLTLGISQGLVWAEKWEFLGKHPEGDMYLEREFVKKKGPITQFWARRVYYTPQESKVSKMTFREQWVLNELDCQKHTMRMAQMLFLDDERRPVGSYIKLDGPPKPIQPEGFFAKEEKILCDPTVQNELSTAAAKKPAVESLKPH